MKMGILWGMQEGGKQSAPDELTQVKDSGK